MPTYLSGPDNARDQLTFVKVTPTLYYGWSAKDLAKLPGISQADVAALGHLTSTSVPSGALRVFAAKSPKPATMKKIINKTPTAAQQGSASTFAGRDSIKTAESEKWNLVNAGRTLNLSNNARTTTILVKLAGGGYYAFPRNTGDVNTHAAALGWELPGTVSKTEREKAFSGTSRPRPAKVKKPGLGSFSSFCASDKLDDALLAGYEILKGEIFY